jgi:hypothetical protein
MRLFTIAHTRVSRVNLAVIELTFRPRWLKTPWNECSAWWLVRHESAASAPAWPWLRPKIDLVHRGLGALTLYVYILIIIDMYAKSMLFAAAVYWSAQCPWTTEDKALVSNRALEYHWAKTESITALWLRHYEPLKIVEGNIALWGQ